MKIRKGFVSNSSSSSFVVAFPKKPESVEELQQMMFGKQQWHYVSFYDSEYSEEDPDVPVSDIVPAVFAKIGERASCEEVYDSIRGGYFGHYIDPEMFPGYANYFDEEEDYWEIASGGSEEARKKREEIWKKHEKINDERAEAIARAFYENNENYIVIMEFSDNAGESVEEHSNIFARLEHIRTSYH